ncbi:MAG: hypothetical protein ACFHHU_13155 [Porticoccaceae bacterium]
MAVTYWYCVVRIGGLDGEPRPSKYQKRIAALRNSAMQEGVHIEFAGIA